MQITRLQNIYIKILEYTSRFFEYTSRFSNTYTSRFFEYTSRFFEYTSRFSNIYQNYRIYIYITRFSNIHHKIFEYYTPQRAGPEVIKPSRVRTCTHVPNRTSCSNSYSYSRSRGYKTFPYSYSYPSRVQIGGYLSKLHSLLTTILKAVSGRNLTNV